MNRNKIEELIPRFQRLVEIAEVRDISTQLAQAKKEEKPFLMVGRLLFLGHNEELAESLIHDLLKDRKHYGMDIPSDYLRTEILNFVLTKKEANQEIDAKAVNDFFKVCRAYKLEKFNVIDQIFGLQIGEEGPVTVGDFKIYNRSLHRDGLRSDINIESEFIFNQFEQGLTSAFLVSTHVQAYDKNDARIKARHKFDEFLFALRFLLGKFSRKYNLYIGPFNDLMSHPILIESTNGLTVSHYYDPGGPELDVKIIIEDYESFWKMFSKEHKSDFERRISSAVIWIGKGLADSDPGRSFVQIIIALESLLQYNLKDQIRPGLTHQLAEYVAFLIGENPTDRKKVFEEVKEYYRLRSSIVHGNTKDIEPFLFDKVLDLVRSSVNRFFHLPKNIRSIDTFHQWVEGQKFEVAGQDHVGPQ